jgi:hypothetical protein
MSITRTTRTALGLAAAAVLLTGCTLPWFGTPVADSPVVRPGELAEAGNRPCPQRLPVGEDPSGHGFGTGETADERPALLEPQKAWVCQYDAQERHHLTARRARSAVSPTAAREFSLRSVRALELTAVAPEARPPPHCFLESFLYSFVHVHLR